MHTAWLMSRDTMLDLVYAQAQKAKERLQDLVELESGKQPITCDANFCDM